MAEEVRFFLRTAASSVVISVVYGFASYDAVRDRYDWAGTVMLVATALAAAAVVGVLLVSVRRARGGAGGAAGATRRSSPLATVRGVIGFTDPAGAANDNPVAAGLDPVPAGSAWPVGAGIGALLVAFGLVFGPWLLLPGLAVTAAVAWGWITQFDRD
jgi:hypothetical protein